MAARKKAATDPHFMPNLEAAIREEARKSRVAASRPALPSPPTAKASTQVAKPKGQETAKEKKPTPLAKPDRGAILKELRSLLPKLDEEGLDFLLEQAKVHLYNMEVERLNSGLAGQKRGSAGKGGAGSAAPETGLALQRSDTGSSFYVWASGDSTMFTAEEMLALVRIAHGHEGELEASRAIGAWLERERRDALEGIRLPGSSRPALVEFARLLRRSFRKTGAG